MYNIIDFLINYQSSILKKGVTQLTLSNHQILQRMRVEHPFFSNILKFMPQYEQDALKKVLNQSANPHGQDDVHNPKYENANRAKEFLMKYETPFWQLNSGIHGSPQERKGLETHLLAILEKMSFPHQKKEELKKYLSFIFNQYQHGTGYPILAQTVALYHQLEVFQSASIWEDLFNVLYEAGYHAYHPDRNPVYRGTPHSCMPGLEMRLLVNNYAIFMEIQDVISHLDVLYPEIAHTITSTGVTRALEMVRAAYSSTHPARIAFENKLLELSEKKNKYPELTDFHIAVEALKSVCPFVREEKIFFDFQEKLIQKSQHTPIQEKIESISATFGAERTEQIQSANHIDLFFGFIQYIQRNEKQKKLESLLQGSTETDYHQWLQQMIKPFAQISGNLFDQYWSLLSDHFFYDATGVVKARPLLQNALIYATEAALKRENPEFGLKIRPYFGQKEWGEFILTKNGQDCAHPNDPDEVYTLVDYWDLMVLQEENSQERLKKIENFRKNVTIELQKILNLSEEAIKILMFVDDHWSMNYVTIDAISHEFLSPDGQKLKYSEEEIAQIAREVKKDLQKLEREYLDDHPSRFQYFPYWGTCVEELADFNSMHTVYFHQVKDHLFADWLSRRSALTSPFPEETWIRFYQQQLESGELTQHEREFLRELAATNGYIKLIFSLEDQQAHPVIELKSGFELQLFDLIFERKLFAIITQYLDDPSHQDHLVLIETMLASVAQNGFKSMPAKLGNRQTVELILDAIMQYGSRKSLSNEIPKIFQYNEVSQYILKLLNSEHSWNRFFNLATFIIRYDAHLLKLVHDLSPEKLEEFLRKIEPTQFDELIVECMQWDSDTDRTLVTLMLSTYQKLTSETQLLTLLIREAMSGWHINITKAKEEGYKRLLFDQTMPFSVSMRLQMLERFLERSFLITDLRQGLQLLKDMVSECTDENDLMKILSYIPNILQHETESFYQISAGELAWIHDAAIRHPQGLTILFTQLLKNTHISLLNQQVLSQMKTLLLPDQFYQNLLASTSSTGKVQPLMQVVRRMIDQYQRSLQKTLIVTSYSSDSNYLLNHSLPFDLLEQIVSRPEFKDQVSREDQIDLVQALIAAYDYQNMRWYPIGIREKLQISHQNILSKLIEECSISFEDIDLYDFSFSFNLKKLEELLEIFHLSKEQYYEQCLQKAPTSYPHHCSRAIEDYLLSKIDLELKEGKTDALAELLAFQLISDSRSVSADVELKLNPGQEVIFRKEYVEHCLDQLVYQLYFGFQENSVQRCIQASLKQCSQNELEHIALNVIQKKLKNYNTVERYWRNASLREKIADFVQSPSGKIEICYYQLLALKKIKDEENNSDSLKIEDIDDFSSGDDPLQHELKYVSTQILKDLFLVADQNLSHGISIEDVQRVIESIEILQNIDSEIFEPQELQSIANLLQQIDAECTSKFSDSWIGQYAQKPLERKSSHEESHPSRLAPLTQRNTSKDFPDHHHNSHK